MALSPATSRSGTFTLGVDGEPGLSGAVTLSPGDGIELTQAGQDIEVAADAVALSREQMVRNGQAIITETVPRGVLSGAAVSVTGRGYFMLAGFLAGDTITGLACMVTNAGTTMTLAKLGVYALDGTRLAQTADVDTQFESVGVKSVPLTAPLAIAADGALYVACLFVSGGTLPSLATNPSNDTALGLVNAAGVLPRAIESGLADLPATAVLSASNANRHYWIAAY